MVQIFNPYPSSREQHIRLTELTDKIKAIFKPGTLVKAQVVKAQGDRVILNVNNNMFQVKSEVPLKAGTWIKGEVQVEQGGQTYLKLLESPEEIELREKTNQFMQKYQNSVENTPLNREIARSILAMDKTPTPKLVNELASFFTGTSGDATASGAHASGSTTGTGQGLFSPENLQAVVFLHLHRLPVNADTVQMAEKLLEVGKQLDPSSSARGEMFLIPEPALATPENPEAMDTSVIRTSLDQLFKMFFTPSGKHDALPFSPGTSGQSALGMEGQGESSASAGVQSDQQQGLLELLGLGRAINAVKNQQDASSLMPSAFWGFFWLKIGQSNTPGEFFLSKLTREGKGSGYFQDRSTDEGLTVGISLTPENLGPIVIRMHLRENVLSLQLIADEQETVGKISAYEDILRQRLKKAGLIVARLENRQANLKDKRIQSRLAKTPLHPAGSLDTRI